MMNAQEQILVALQELDSMLKEAQDSEDQFRRLGFAISGVEELARARTQLVEQLEPTHAQHYERMVARYGRAVTPVTGAMCLGCFAAVPQVYRSSAYEGRVRMCQNCGRILYFP
jgi:predicted  nucleic acid-binding Zn-ribbon protein